MEQRPTENTAGTTPPPEVKPVRGRPFPPGVSGNPAGKPKGARHLSTLLWKALLVKAKTKDGLTSEKTYADLVIERVLKDAIEKGSRLDLIFDRIEGAPLQALDVTSGGEKIENSNAADVLAIARRVSEELKKQKT